MPDNELKIILGADGKPLEKTLQESAADLKLFSKQLQTASDPAVISNLNKGLRDTQKNIAAIKGLGVNAFSGLRPGANEAALAMQNVGRVAQDLPFGFIGIQNNLNPLLESFVRLKAETGSTGGALKAMAASLGGVGGVGLALSVVSSAIVIYQNGIAGFNSKTKEATDKFDEFVKSLRSVSDVILESTGSVQGQIELVRSLSTVVQDETKSQRERLHALEELKKANKAYFGDLTLQEASLKTLKTLTDEYTNALISQAVVKGFTDEISKLAPELAKQERELKKVATAYALVKQNQENLLKTAIPSAQNFAGDFSQIKKLSDAADVEKDFVERVNKVGELRTAYDDLKNSMSTAVETAQKFKSTETGPKDKKAVDVLKEQIQALEDLKNKTGLLKVEQTKLFELQIKLVLRDGLKDGLDKGQVERIVNDFQQQIDQSQISRIQLPIAISPLGSTKIADSLTGVLSPDFNKPIIDRMEKAGREAGVAYNQALKEKLGKEIAQTLTTGVTAAFVSIGEGLGNALSGNGGLAEAAQGFLSIIGSVLQQVGKEVIVASQLVIALKAALNSLFAAGPAGAIATIGVGIALVAAGAALKNIKFSGPKLAQGGITTGPTIAQIGEAGREVVLPLNKLSSILGGNQNNINIEGYISNDVIRLAVQRAVRSQDRRF